MIIDNERIVTLDYMLYDDNHQLIESTYDSRPIEFMYGKGYVIPGLERAIKDKKAGDKLKVSVSVEDAYGPYREALVQKVDPSIFQLESHEIQVGQQYRAETDEGEKTIIIIEILDDGIIINGNHPLAGKNLSFDVEIISVRLATLQEVARGTVYQPETS